MSTEKTKRKSKMIKLTCKITGASRNTTPEYLDAKASRLNCSREDIVNNYVSKPGLKQMIAENKVDEATKELYLKYNGGKRNRQKKAVELKKAA